MSELAGALVLPTIIVLLLLWLLLMAMMMRVVCLRKTDAFAANFHAGCCRPGIFRDEQQPIAAEDRHMRQEQHLHGRARGSYACSGAPGKSMRSRGGCRSIPGQVGPRLHQRRARSSNGRCSLALHERRCSARAAARTLDGTDCSFVNQRATAGNRAGRS